MEKYTHLDKQNRINLLPTKEQKKHKLIYENAIKKTPLMLELLKEDIQKDPDHYKYWDMPDDKVRKHFFSKTPLSNMYKTDVYYEETLWPSTEHAYMHKKFDFDNLKTFFNNNTQIFKKIKENLEETFIKYHSSTNINYDTFFTLNNLESMYSNPEINGIFIKELSKEFEKINLRVEDWENIKLKTLTTLNIIKYTNSPYCREYLEETRGQKLIEWNFWNDTFWGVCKNSKKGKNYLGRILQILRDDKNFSMFEIYPKYNNSNLPSIEEHIENIKYLTETLRQNTKN